MSSLLEHSSADISDDGRYRYRLVRQWDHRLPSMVWCMLNPSTADADVDDPTIRRCRKFAKRENCGGITVVNLFAYRATVPNDLRTVSDPWGPENLDWVIGVLDVCAAEGGILVCGWGGWLTAHNATKARDRLHRINVEWLARERGVRAMCIGRTQRDDPKHPLARGRERVPDDAPLIPLPVIEQAQTLEGNPWLW